MKKQIIYNDFLLYSFPLTLIIALFVFHAYFSLAHSDKNNFKSSNAYKELSGIFTCATSKYKCLCISCAKTLPKSRNVPMPKGNSTTSISYVSIFILIFHVFPVRFICNKSYFHLQFDGLNSVRYPILIDICYDKYFELILPNANDIIVLLLQSVVSFGILTK